MKKYNVILNGRIWCNCLSESKAAAEAIRARKCGLGMAYVVRAAK